jgi:hypothetical protein
VISGRNGDIVDLFSKGDPDVMLSFDASEDGKPAVLLPGHSQILSAWSSVLSGAVEAALTCTNARHSGSCKEAPCIAAATAGQPDAVSAQDATSEAEAAVKAIPMPGTSMQEWLEVAAFMYPIIPPAQVRAGITGPSVQQRLQYIMYMRSCMHLVRQPAH